MGARNRRKARHCAAVSHSLRLIALCTTTIFSLRTHAVTVTDGWSATEKATSDTQSMQTPERPTLRSLGGAGRYLSRMVLT